MKAIFTLLFLCALLAPLAPAAEVPRRTPLAGLNVGNVEQNYRHRTFCAYLSHDAFVRRTKTARYSSFENPTGIFFNAEDTATITVNGSAGHPLTLVVHDFEENGGHSEYPLHEGSNTFTIRNRGLAYVEYRSDTPDACPAVKVHIEGGQVNGIFTRQDDAATWKRLLANAKCNILDMMGERVQLTYDVQSLRQACPTDGPQMLALYDEIIRMEQEDILGWHLDATHPGNHIHGRVQWKGFMHADGFGAAFHVSAIPGITQRLRQEAWGVAHEFGHVNQTRPGMCWVGTTEVTNNICSAWVNYKLNPSFTRLEHEYTQNIDGEPMRGGRFDCYINNALVRRRLWQFHGGPDGGLTEAPTDHPGDHFVSVCPLWQLQLYMAVVCQQADFFPSIFRHVRATDESRLTQGQLRVLFFKRACDAARLDLSEFFVKLGMLAPIDRTVRDYVVAPMTITPEMCRESIAYASRYPKPDSSVIYYLTTNSLPIFAERQAVVPTLADYTPTNGRLHMPSDVWKNAVAFECYAGNKLLRICLRGLGCKDGASTVIPIPEGTDAIKAVQWDGQRFDIGYRKPE